MSTTNSITSCETTFMGVIFTSFCTGETIFLHCSYIDVDCFIRISILLERIRPIVRKVYFSVNSGLLWLK